MKRLLLINEDIKDYEILKEAINDITCCVIYSWKNDTVDEIIKRIKKILGENRLETIGFVFHGKANKPFQLLKSLEPANINKFDKCWNDHLDFIWKLRKSFLLLEEPHKDKNNDIIPRFDILACCMLYNEAGKKIHNKLESMLGVPITASNDETGNTNTTNPNADWILESHNIDARATYFIKDKLDKFKFTLSNGGNNSINLGNLNLNNLNLNNQIITTNGNSESIRNAPNDWTNYKNELSTLKNISYDLVNSYTTIKNEYDNTIFSNINNSVNDFEDFYEQLTDLQDDIEEVYRAVDFINKASRLSSGLQKIVNVLYNSVKISKNLVDKAVDNLKPIHNFTKKWQEKFDNLNTFVDTSGEIADWIIILNEKLEIALPIALDNCNHYINDNNCTGDNEYQQHINLYNPILQKFNEPLKSFDNLLNIINNMVEYLSLIIEINSLKLDDIAKFFSDIAPGFKGFNSGLDFKLKFNLIFYKVRVSIRDIIEGISGAVSDVLDFFGFSHVMKLVDKEILDPLLKAIPGLNDLLVPDFIDLPNLPSFNFPSFDININYTIDLQNLLDAYNEAKSLTNFLDISNLNLSNQIIHNHAYMGEYSPITEDYNNKKQNLKTEYDEKLQNQENIEHTQFDNYTYSEQYGNMHPGELTQMLQQNNWNGQRETIDNWYNNSLTIIEQEYEQLINLLNTKYNIVNT